MPSRPSRHTAHLIVAAIRIFEHLHRHPPTDGEIAELLGWHEDHVRLLTRRLEESGIVAPVRSPHDVRFQIADHCLIDELEDDDHAAEAFAQELAEFDQRAREEQEKLENLFREGATGKKHREKLRSLDDEFSKFKGSKPVNPFGDD